MQDNVEQSQETSFIRKLFNWKYIVPLVVIQGILLYASSIAYNNDLSKRLNFVMLIVVYLISKRVSSDVNGKIISKRQYVSFFIYLVFTFLVLPVIMGAILYYANILG